MRPAPFIFLFIFSAFLASANPAESSVTVNLKNGNTLSADSCRMEKNRLFLKYPLGEVELPLSQVESVKGEDGSAFMFQDRGQRVEKPQQSAPARPQFPAPPPGFSPAVGRAARQQPDEAARKKWLDEHPQGPPKPQTEAEKKADAFLDRYFSASGEEQEKMEKELETVINQLFDEEDEGLREAKGAKGATEK